MPEQFVVPQFIDAEDKIIGPITARQFIILMVAGFIVFALFRLASFTVFLLTGIPIVVMAGIVAFIRINGQPFHFFLLNLVQTFRKPGLRVWNKQLNDSELRVYIRKEPPPPPVTFTRKPPPAGSRLQELSLVVNTGGVYKPEE